MRETDKNPKPVYQLKTILDALFRNEREMKITVDDTTLFNDMQVYREMYRYYDFFYIPEELPDLEPLSAPADFRESWLVYCLTNGENLKREFDALYSEYNPIENYSLTESALDGVKLDKTETETTPTGTATVETELKRFGLNSTNGENADKTTNTETFTNRKDTTNTTPKNTLSENYGTETFSNYHELRNHRFQRSGNIGTMTPADMIEKEKSIRRDSLLSGFVNRFINQFCFYVS